MMRSGIAAAALLTFASVGAAAAQHHEVGPSAPPLRAPAHARTATSLEAAFEAAGRGDLGPLRRLLPAAREDAAVLIRARLAIARFDPAPADPAVARIAAAADPVHRMAALSILAADAFRRGAYGDAARWGRAFAAAQAERGDP